MDTFMLHVYSAERVFFEGICRSLTVPVTDGQYGIMAHHRNMIAAIRTGTMRFVTEGGSSHIAAVSDGMVKVEDNDVLVLADTAEAPEEIDEKIARRSADEAKEAMLQKKSVKDYHAAEAQMARALSRLKVKQSEQ